MELTREQKHFLKVAIAETENVLKNADTMDEKGATWELWLAYDALSSVYHALRGWSADKQERATA